MPTARKRTRGQRAGLTQHEVVQAAHDVLRAQPGGTLSMRTVATALGVAPNAIYSHYASRDALVDAVLDDALAAVPVPAETARPAVALRAVMVDTYDLLMARPQLLELYVNRSGSRGPNAQRLGQRMQELLRVAGLRPARATLAVQVLIVHSIGFAAFAAAARGSSSTKSAAVRRREFTQALDWLLAGMGVSPSRV